MEYIVPIDAPHPEDNFILFRDSSLSLFEVDHYIRSTLSQHVMVILNGCTNRLAFSFKLRTENQVLTGRGRHSVREFILGSKVTGGPAESVTQGLYEALEGEADKNNDGIVSGRELEKYLKQNQRKDEILFFGELDIEDTMAGEFIFNLQPLDSEKYIASVPTIRTPFIEKSNLNDNFSRTRIPNKETLLIPSSILKEAIKPSPFIKLSPKEIEENVFWPETEIDLLEKVPWIKEETFIEGKHQKNVLKIK